MTNDKKSWIDKYKDAQQWERLRMEYDVFLCKQSIEQTITVEELSDKKDKLEEKLHNALKDAYFDKKVTLIEAMDIAISPGTLHALIAAGK